MAALAPRGGRGPVALGRSLAAAAGAGAGPAGMAPRPAPRRVLLTNDDGPESPFVHVFKAALRERLGWRTFTVLPDGEWSYVSKSVTKGACSLRRVAEAEVYLAGSPASCVNVALHHLVQDVDLVLSGPNIGHNAGRKAIHSSGTVGAVVEGVLHGTKGIALSFPFRGWGSWTDAQIEKASNEAVEVVADLWESWPAKPEDGSPEVEYFNVNIPIWLPVSGKSEWKFTFADRVGYTSLFKPNAEEDGFVWGPASERVFENPNAQAGSDVATIAKGQVSITPMTAEFLRPAVPGFSPANQSDSRSREYSPSRSSSGPTYSPGSSGGMAYSPTREEGDTAAKE